MKFIFYFVTIIENSVLDVYNPYRWYRDTYPDVFKNHHRKNTCYLNKSSLFDRHSSVKALKDSELMEDLEAKLAMDSCQYLDFGQC